MSALKKRIFVKILKVAGLIHWLQTRSTKHYPKLTQVQQQQYIVSPLVDYVAQLRQQHRAQDFQREFYIAVQTNDASIYK